MEKHKIQIIETAFVILGFVFSHFLTKRSINNTLKQTHLDRRRRKIIIKSVQLLTLLAALVLLSAIWGLDQDQIAVYVGTILTALGIAFFAQWSLLSNITSSLLLLFNHPIKIGDTIKIMDKDFPFEGEVSDLTYLFVHLKTLDGELITIPNSLLLQKSISIKSKNHDSH